MVLCTAEMNYEYVYQLRLCCCYKTGDQPARVDVVILSDIDNICAYTHTMPHMVCKLLRESDLVVLTTANQLREEIRSQLNEALADSLPDFSCSCDSDNTTQLSALPDQDLAVTVEELKECVSNIKSVTDLLLSQFSHLLTPGYSPSHPASSCKEILQLAPQSPTGLYWIRGTDNGPKHMYCDMERSCKGVAGGWMRLASIDMTDIST